MFDEKYIQMRIEIIFNIESKNLLNDNSFHYIEKMESPGADSGRVRPMMMDLQLSPNTALLKWDTYDTLRRLYNNIEKDSKSRQIFIDILKEKIVEGNCISLPYHDDSSLALYFLLKIGKNEDIIEAITKKIQKHKTSMGGLFSDILVFMNCEPQYFDDDFLTILKEQNLQILYIWENKDKLDAKIDSIRYSNLQNELAGVNEALNIHKEQVIDIISKFGFPPELEKFLLEIDRISELPDWESINSGMIGNLRAFFEELTKNIANHIKTITKVDYPKKTANHMGNLRLYINENLYLSTRDDKLIDAFIDILHKEGGHAFLSEKRYFLLAKNIGIEIAYFLLSKLDDFSEGKMQR